MSDPTTIPAWAWMPTAVALWAWLIVPPVARRLRRVSALIAQAFADWRECRADYELALYAAYEAAADATNDRLLNDRGRRAGIDPVSLFMGTERRAHAYASPELLEHWEQRPRLTFAAFERQWMASGLAAIDPDGVSLQGAEYPGPDERERYQAAEDEPQQSRRYPDDHEPRNRVHLHTIEGIGR